MHKLLAFAIAVASLPSATPFVGGFRDGGHITVRDLLGRQAIRGGSDARCRGRLMTLGASSAVDAPRQNEESLKGVAGFEEWFEAAAGARVNSIKHSFFRSYGRGLEFTSTSSKDLSGVIEAPRRLVLRVPYSEEEDSDWDAKLATKLFDECKKGRSSDYWGYCSLLCKGENLNTEGDCRYSPTAPDALRHWTDTEKEILEGSESGRKLLRLASDQEEKWRRKYESVEGMTYEQFSWAMEAVHSRAFRGEFGALDAGEGGQLRKIASLLLPFSALTFGFFAATDPGMNDYYLPAALVAASPVVLTAIADQQGSKEAVMLPFIDSANHLQEADSVIEYDPVKESFVLSLGRRCLVKEQDGSAQVCISYGIRSDSELLLNYGFVRGFSMEGLTDRSLIRKRLAEAYLSGSGE